MKRTFFLSFIPFFTSPVSPNWNFRDPKVTVHSVPWLDGSVTEPWHCPFLVLGVCPLFPIFPNNNLIVFAGWVHKILQQPSYNDLRNIALTSWWSYGTTPVPYNHQPAQISRDSWILSMYGTILKHTIILRSIIIPYCHQLARAGFSCNRS